MRSPRMFAMRRCALLAAVLLLLVVLPVSFAGATPSSDSGGCGTTAHPSGKDPCVESGGSDTQGSPTSDPDDNDSGPEGSAGESDKDDGGVNTGDQDGNNGCGNDQDFEDDNEGLCGGNPDAGADAKDKPSKAEKAEKAAKVEAARQNAAEVKKKAAARQRAAAARQNAEARNGAAANRGPVGTLGIAGVPSSSVTGVSETRNVAPVDAAPDRMARVQAALAATGVADIVAMSIVALLLLCVGTLTVLKTRDRSNR